jgi:WhiB family transcriptional regulator, redox-sensing transcriptional regulator
MTGHRVHTTPTAARDWRDRAACRDADPEAFFPDATRGVIYVAAVEYAKTTCRRCPVVTACLSWALGTRQEYGIWGGTTEPERKALLRRRHPLADPQIAAALAEVRAGVAVTTERIRTLAGAGHTDAEIAAALMREQGGTWTDKTVRQARRAAGIQPGYLTSRRTQGRVA